uniref:Uncharacterized protein n=1 Tax=Panagrolaimus davidi TaxID=227884 RepID=A0A914QUK1_9BILA
MKTKAGAMVQIIRTNKEADVVIFEWVAGKKFEVQELECGTFELGEKYTSIGILGNTFAAGHGSMRRCTGSHYIGDGEAEKGDSGSPVFNSALQLLGMIVRKENYNLEKAAGTVMINESIISSAKHINNVIILPSSTIMNLLGKGRDYCEEEEEGPAKKLFKQNETQ